MKNHYQDFDIALEVVRRPETVISGLLKGKRIVGLTGWTVATIFHAGNSGSNPLEDAGALFFPGRHSDREGGAICFFPTGGQKPLPVGAATAKRFDQLLIQKPLPKSVGPRARKNFGKGLMMEVAEKQKIGTGPL